MKEEEEEDEEEGKMKRNRKRERFLDYSEPTRRLARPHLAGAGLWTSLEI